MLTLFPDFILQLKNIWKFPGGLSEPGEDIGDTAFREVFEETGIKSEFKSLLSILQQHANPGAFGKSDMYIIFTRLLLYGYRERFDKIDFTTLELPAVYTGLFYKLYHKELTDNYRTMTGMD
ncbi:unnamed protein product [Nyctereutes procyonoides]|uniref:Nucleoside diphosphate-linked moiety X motif 6 n=1 Tax=Nyctereutes procyonoides TaxID=34880 RepID=A0A811ZK23_NYCPR|nr:unnamed protein product [Nyctereutes procyonoides]